MVMLRSQVPVAGQHTNADCCSCHKCSPSHVKRRCALTAGNVVSQSASVPGLKIVLYAFRNMLIMFK